MLTGTGMTTQSHISIKRLLTAAAVTFVFTQNSHAATFLIPDGDVVALQDALDESATNGESDVIDLQGGVFTLNSPASGTQSGLVLVAEPITETGMRLNTEIINGTIERSLKALTTQLATVPRLEARQALRLFFLRSLMMIHVTVV